MSFLGGIHFKEFLSTHQEWHAAIIGLCYGYCPWAPRFPISRELKRQVIREHHYFVSGTAIGFLLLILSIAGAVVWVLRHL